MLLRGNGKKIVGASKDDFHDLPCYRLASLQEDHGWWCWGWIWSTLATPGCRNWRWSDASAAGNCWAAAWVLQINCGTTCKVSSFNFLFKGVSPPFGKDIIRKPTGLKQPHSFRFVEDVDVLQGILVPFFGRRKHVFHIAGTIFAISCWKHVLTGFGEVIPHPLATKPRRRNMSREISTLQHFWSLSWKPKRSMYAHVWSIYLHWVFWKMFSPFFWGDAQEFTLLSHVFFFPPLCEPGIMESHIVRSTDFHSFTLHHFG